jgi:hypothetical protein
MTRNLADKGIDIQAVSSWVEGPTGYIRLVTNDHQRAADELKAKNFHVEERDAIQVIAAHKIGMLKMLTEFLAREQIDIHHLYASARTNDAECRVLLATSNNDHAIVTLNKTEGFSI